MCTAPGPSGPRAFYRWSLDAAGGFSAGAAAAPAIAKSVRPRLQFSPARQRQPQP